MSADFERIKREILDRVSLVDVVSEHVSLKRRGRRLIGLCPFHQEKTPSFGVSPELGLFKCFGCGKGGDLFSFIQLRDNLPFAEALALLADRAGVELISREKADPRAPSRVDLFRVNEWALVFFRAALRHPTAGRQAMEYLTGRGFTDATLDAFAVGLAAEGTPSLIEAAGRAGFSIDLLVAADLVRRGDQGRTYETFRQRIMFPIRDAAGRVMGFGGRTLVDDPAKYLNTRQTALFDKGRHLYGVDTAREAIGKTGRAIVVEGYTDCLACHQAGFQETVATLGTALGESQVDLLRRYAERVILLFDSDEAGEAAAERAIRVAVPRSVTCLLARVPSGKDPSEFLAQSGPDEFSDVLKRAVDALEFRWLRTLRRFHGDESDARRREAVLDFLRVVAEASSSRSVDVIQRGLLVNQVAHLLRMDRGEVDRLLARLTRTGPAAGATKARGPGVVGMGEGVQSAWSRIMEVLLNEPGLLARVQPRPDVSTLADPRDRRIVTALFDLHETLDDVRLVDVLARCHAVEDAERIDELIRRGETRGNFEATLQVALWQLGHTGEADGPVAADAAGSTSNEPASADTTKIAGLPRFAGDREFRSFVPPRLRLRPVGEAPAAAPPSI